MSSVRLCCPKFSRWLGVKALQKPGLLLGAENGLRRAMLAEIRDYLDSPKRIDSGGWPPL